MKYDNIQIDAKQVTDLTATREPAAPISVGCKNGLGFNLIRPEKAIDGFTIIDVRKGGEDVTLSIVSAHKGIHGIPHEYAMLSPADVAAVINEAGGLAKFE